MLYTISRGNVPQYQDGQDSIVHLVVDPGKIDAAGLVYTYTDGHAVIELSEFFTNLNDVAKHVDFNLMKARYWYDTDREPDRKRRRQAEFLVHESLPWRFVEEVGVMSEAVRVKVLEALRLADDHQPPVVVRPAWYY